MTNTIDGDVMENATAALCALDQNAIGDVHTVTLTLDGASGRVRMTVESARYNDVVLEIE